MNFPQCFFIASRPGPFNHPGQKRFANPADLFPNCRQSQRGSCSSGHGDSIAIMPENIIPSSSAVSVSTMLRKREINVSNQLLYAADHNDSVLFRWRYKIELLFKWIKQFSGSRRFMHFCKIPQRLRSKNQRLALRFGFPWLWKFCLSAHAAPLVFWLWIDSFL